MSFPEGQIKGKSGCKDLSVLISGVEAVAMAGEYFPLMVGSAGGAGSGCGSGSGAGSGDGSGEGLGSGAGLGGVVDEP